MLEFVMIFGGRRENTGITITYADLTLFFSAAKYI